MLYAQLVHVHARPGRDGRALHEERLPSSSAFSSAQHPEAEKVIEAIKETGRIEWLNYDRANHVSMDYLAYAKDRKGWAPNCKVPTMVMFPEDDMFLWKTQAIDTPSRHGRRVPHRDHPGRPLVHAGSSG